ncbi:TetR/AcrR family transcriptional regulator [Mycobacterium simiae]|nr:TetR family transcriptional regulator [Mycobacterium simiae]
MAEPEPSRSRNPYQNTAVSLMHNGVLDALHGLLLTRKWTSITMADVASAAGVSRGTIYNEFQSRSGLARSYALRLTDTIVTGMRTAINEHHGDGYAAMRTVFRDFFDRVQHDPLAQVLRTEDAPNDILRLITVESQFLVDHASQHLSQTFQNSWVNADEYDAEVMGRAVVRAALSFLALPPRDADQAAKGMARLLAPFIESIGR